MFFNVSVVWFHSVLSQDWWSSVDLLIHDCHILKQYWPFNFKWSFKEEIQFDHQDLLSLRLNPACLKWYNRSFTKELLTLHLLHLRIQSQCELISMEIFHWRMLIIQLIKLLAAIGHTQIFLFLMSLIPLQFWTFDVLIYCSLVLTLSIDSQLM